MNNYSDLRLLLKVTLSEGFRISKISDNQSINNINYFSKLPVNLSILIYTATNLSYTALVNGFLLQNIAFIFIILMLIITVFL